MNRKHVLSLCVLTIAANTFALSIDDAFIKACEGGNCARAEQLLEEGANIEARDGSDRQTALVFAANRGHADVVRMLIAHGANINAQDDKGWTALSEASYRGRHDVVEFLLEKGASTLLSTSWLDSREYGNALFWCIESTHNEYSKKVSITELLLENNAEPEGHNDARQDALAIAKSRGYKEIVELLEKYRKERIAKLNEYALLEAVRTQNLAGVKKYLEKKVSPNSLLPNGESILNYAVSAQNYGIVKLLLENGANPNVQNALGVTAFMTAVKYGNEPIARLLMNSGTNKNQRDNVGRTALFYAVENNSTSLLSAIVRDGANVNATDMYGMDAFLYACTQGNISACKFLLSNGADAATSDMYGVTALHIAAQKGLVQLARLILSDGSADIYAVDSVGNDVFYYAEKGGSRQIQMLLEEYRGW